VPASDYRPADDRRHQPQRHENRTCRLVEHRHYELNWRSATARDALAQLRIGPQFFARVNKAVKDR
jgi:hypothetical protein